MCNFKPLLISALALAAFASIAIPANAALPSLLQLPGVTSGTLEATSKTAATKFTGIVNVTGTGYRLRASSNFEMTSLGPALLTFTQVLFGTKSCKADGDTAGNVLIPGEAHAVLAASGGGANLFLILFLVTPSLLVECEGTNITVTGSQLIAAEPFGKEVTSGTATTGKCSGNTPEFTTYLNDAGASVTAGLKSETGGLKSATCQEVQGTQTATASGMGAEVMEP